MVKIHKVSLTDKEYNGINGEIVKVTQDEIYVKIEDGSIKIGELQFPGKRKMTTSEYLKGNSIEVGTVLK
jgi:methionyl-tRNA formyltransferase